MVQVFGFDFMLDADFRVWLIEVNGSPAVAQKLLPDFTRDLVRLVIDPLFPLQVCGFFLTEEACREGTQLEGTGNLSEEAMASHNR